MSNPTLTADGIDLNSIAYAVGVDSNRWSVPGAKGENVVVPSRHGSLWVADKTFTEGEFKLELIVQGATEYGTVPLDQLAQARKNIDTILRVFTKRKKLIHLVQSYDDGSAIECFAECTGAFDVTRTSAALPYARMNIGLKVPDAFWQDTTLTTFTSSAGITGGDILQMPPFDGGTAPMDDAMYLIHGPITDPELYVHLTGAFTRLEKTVQQGETWRVNAADWTSVCGTTVTFESTGDTSVIHDTMHGGSSTFVDIPPLAYGDYAIELGGTNSGASTQLEVRGRRKYLVS